MTEIIGVSGAHNTGKSTALRGLSARNYAGVRFEEQQVSRAVQAELGLDLAAATADAATAQDFQTRILKKKYDLDLAILASPEGGCVFVDRTPADIYAYTRMWVEQNNIDRAWFAAYTEQCIYQMRLYAHIWFIPIVDEALIPFVTEPGRASRDSREIHSQYTEEFLNAHALSWSPIQSISVEDRIDELVSRTKNKMALRTRVWRTDPAGAYDRPVDIWLNGSWVPAYFSEIRKGDFFLDVKMGVEVGKCFMAHSDAKALTYGGKTSFMVQGLEVVQAPAIKDINLIPVNSGHKLLK